MVDALPWFATQVVPLAIAGTVLGILVYSRWSRRGQPNTFVGEIPAGPAPRSARDTMFSGTTDGIGWHLAVTNDNCEVDDGLATRRANSHAATTWGTEYLRAPGAMLVMNIPESATSRTASNEAGGTLAGLAGAAARFALQSYAAQRFGLARANRSSWKRAQRVAYAAKHFSTRFEVFSDPPELKDRLSAGARDALVRAHAAGVSMLWDQDGLALHWPLAKRTDEDIEAAAELGCAIAHALEDQAPNPA
ncbi:MAG TPA: hypothetical protein VFV17_03865 [Usitatibacteraceae bacterium]|nr:hypothetical protein [Usitatibacteraceae bacterium]